MTILIVGRQGQVARSLVERAREQGVEVSAIGRPDLDLEEKGSAREAIRRRAPKLVVNAAAYTMVDRAEEEPDRAFRINGEAAQEIAAAADGLGCPLIHLSTDYVFDGTATRPLVETDPVGPINVYGLSKLAGEEGVRSAGPRHIILRTSWVYSPFGNNFVRTMLRLGSEREELGIVADQRGCPTSAIDLADAILHLASLNPGALQFGTYHLAGPGECSWAEFAEEVFAAASPERPMARVRPIATADYPTPARRPQYSVLDSGLFARTFGHAMPPRAPSLALTVAHILGEGARA